MKNLHKKAEKNVIKTVGEVIESLPNGFFRIMTELEVEGEPVTILGHLSGKMRQRRIRVILGDTVQLEISPYDPTKARIIYREAK